MQARRDPCGIMAFHRLHDASLSLPNLLPYTLFPGLVFTIGQKWRRIFRKRVPSQINDTSQTGSQSVTISREDIEKVAELARIRVEDEQISALQNDLGNILNLVSQLSSADTSAVEPLAHPLDMVQRLREDEVTETDQREAFQALASATAEGLYLVPRVIE